MSNSRVKTNPFAKGPSIPKNQVPHSTVEKKDASRENAKKQLLNSLEPRSDSQIENIVLTSEQLSIELEGKIYAQSGNVSQSKDYRDKIRKYELRIKGSRNQNIREILKKGIITPEQFCSLDEKTLTNDNYFKSLLGNEVESTNNTENKPLPGPPGPKKPRTAKPPKIAGLQIHHSIKHQEPENNYPENTQNVQNNEKEQQNNQINTNMNNQDEINNAHLQNEIKLENKDPIELSNNQFNEFTIQSSHNIENINEQNIEQPVLNHEEKKEIPNTKAPTIETPIINDNNDKKSNNQTSSRSRLEELNQRLSNRKKKKVLNNNILSKQAEQKKINNDNTNTSNNNLNIPPKKEEIHSPSVPVPSNEKIIAQVHSNPFLDEEPIKPSNNTVQIESKDNQNIISEIPQQNIEIPQKEEEKKIEEPQHNIDVEPIINEKNSESKQVQDEIKNDIFDDKQENTNKEKKEEKDKILQKEPFDNKIVTEPLSNNQKVDTNIKEEKNDKIFASNQKQIVESNNINNNEYCFTSRFDNSYSIMSVGGFKEKYKLLNEAKIALETEFEFKKKENEALLKEIISLKKIISELRDKNSKSNEEMLQFEIVKLKQTVQNKINEIDKLKEENQKLKNQVKSYDENFNLMKTNNKLFREEAEKRFNLYQKEIETLRSKAFNEGNNNNISHKNTNSIMNIHHEEFICDGGIHNKSIEKEKDKIMVNTDFINGIPNSVQEATSYDENYLKMNGNIYDETKNDNHGGYKNLHENIINNNNEDVNNSNSIVNKNEINKEEENDQVNIHDEMNEIEKKDDINDNRNDGLIDKDNEIHEVKIAEEEPKIEVSLPKEEPPKKQIVESKPIQPIIPSIQKQKEEPKKETNTPFENSNNTKSANTNNNNNIFGSEGDNLNDNEDVNDIFSSKPAQVAPVKRVKPTIPKAISQNLKEVKQEKPNPFAPKFKKKKEFLFNEFENELDDDDIFKKDGNENIFESSSGTKTKSIFD